jgi:hypothetical protein
MHLSGLISEGWYTPLTGAAFDAADILVFLQIVPVHIMRIGGVPGAANDTFYVLYGRWLVSKAHTSMVEW